MQLKVLNDNKTQTQHVSHTPDVDVHALEADLNRSVRGEVRFDTTTRAIYATDSSNYRQVPIGVVVPLDADDVVAAVRVCHAHGAPITSRGSATSLAGQTCNVAVILDFSKHLNQILEIDPQRQTARVQPGVILDHLRNKAEEHNLTFGPDPSTHAWCTFGGMIGNNACGVHSIMAGRTADCIEEMEILTYDGQRMRVGATDDADLERIINAGGRRGDIYRGMRDIRDRHADLIRQRYPDIPRRVSGYNLDELLPENNFQVARALVGTEGTCVFVLEATIKLVPSPPVRSLLVLGYKDVYEAGDHVPQIMSFGPVGLEGIDDRLVRYMKLKGIHPQDVQLLPDGGGWLMVEFGGDTEEESDGKAKACMDKLRHDADPPSMKLFDDPKETHQLWEVRESGLSATAHVPGMGATWPGWEDAAIDPNHLGDYLRDFRALLEKYDYACALYGHFGQGCVHCRIDFDLITHEGLKKYRSFIGEASDLVVKYNGSFSAEHGDGQARAIFLPKMYGSELVDAMRRFKQLWDPDWKMNPGKVIDPDQPTSNLRLGTDYEPWEPSTFYHYPEDDNSFSKVSLRCVGVGKCLRENSAFMCPSYLATHDEQHTTRGRGCALYEMLQGEEVTEGWRSEAVRDTLDLCLGCKGCKLECPVSVDMATYKSEFLAHHYAGRIRPRSFYAMGLIGWWARLASTMPALANFASQAPGLRRIAKLATGVASQRQLPMFASETFMHWHRRQGRETASQTKHEMTEVVLYPDTFNNYFYPETLKSAMHVLQRLGYRVHVPATEPPAIRPALHYGMLHLAKRDLRRTVRQLRHYARQGTSIIVLEPSTASVFRDELLRLFPHDPDSERIQQNVKLLSEFLDHEQVTLPTLNREAILHGHCHQKAVLDMESSRRLLRKMGLKMNEPEVGCCGMAGSFGFEAEHYDVSMKIADMNLLPAVRDASLETLVIADGFSCREQVRESTGRIPLHFAEVIQMAFDAPPPQPRPESRYISHDKPMLHPAWAAGIGGALLGTIGLMWWQRRKRR